MLSRFDVDMQALLHLTSVPVLSSGCFLHNLFFQHNTRHFAYIIYDSQFHICFRPIVWPTPGTNRTATHAWKLQLSRQLESSARHWGVWFDSANEFCSLQIRSPRVKTGIVWIPCCLWILILDVQPSIFACQEFQREKNRMVKPRPQHWVRLRNTFFVSFLRRPFMSDTKRSNSKNDQKFIPANRSTLLRISCCLTAVS